MSTVIICGGRDFDNREMLFARLDDFHQHTVKITRLIHGGARGADTLAGEWATARGVEAIACPANWKQHGRGAGPIRNQKMLDENNVAWVIAFQGGRGTADMTRRARRSSVSTWVVR